MDLIDQVKLDQMIAKLEATQNRFIYKSLDQNFTNVEEGTVLMLPNPKTASTLSAPILVVENRFPLD